MKRRSGAVDSAANDDDDVDEEFDDDALLDNAAVRRELANCHEVGPTTRSI